MSTSPLIDLRGVAKAYALYEQPIDMLKEFLFGGIRHDLFWALRDISLSVAAGQRLGVIGPNGAGKSTLLQIITGTLQPSTGSVTVNGSISALLSLVPAWNVEQTGLENIRFNLMLRGCGAREIKHLAEDIVEFAELGPFIHQPVKTYSAGMSARLSFAIGTAISPEILVIDEVLGVGDGYFAAKAMRRMNAMCDAGKALLFVSHSTAAIRQICDTALWLEAGTVRLLGPVDYVVTQYEQDTARGNDDSVRTANRARSKRASAFVAPDEVLEPDSVRLRLRPDDEGASVHLVRDIEVSWAAAEKIEVQRVHLTPPADVADAYLDVLGCAWGRLYSKQGHDSRILAARTGARAGGHIIVRRPAEFLAKPWPIELRWTAKRESGSGTLTPEIVDYETATWRPLAVTATASGAGGWINNAASAVIPPRDEEAIASTIRTAQQRRITPVQVSELVVCSESGSGIVRECEPFAIRVALDCLEGAPDFNVSLIIYRSDGLYTFWQPSDFHGQRKTGGARFVAVTFQFDENLFAAGEYDVTVNVTSPWHLEIVQSEVEIFDRKTNALRFTVTREFKQLQFGAVNQRARVTVDMGDEPDRCSVNASVEQSR